MTADPDTLICPSCGSLVFHCGHSNPFGRTEPHRGESWRVALLIVVTAVVIAIMASGACGTVRGAEIAAPAQSSIDRRDKSILVAPKLTHTEADAVGWTFDALLKYPADQQPYIRCVYLPAWATPEWVGAVDFAMNSAASHSRNLVRGDRHAGGYLLAYNFAMLAPDLTRRAKLLATWDGLATAESKFHVPEIDQVTKQPVAILAPHLAAALARHATDETQSQRIDVLLAQITRGTGAVYPAEFVVEQLLTSIRGKYPEFRQWDFAPKGSTALQNLFRERGYFLEATVAVGGERGAMVLISGVTGKPRVAAAIPGISNRTPATITFDFNDANIRPDARFIRNLVDFPPPHDASETLLPMSNGLIEYTLADGKGALQRAAPPNVVTDSTKPDGHTKELENGASCIICHGPEDGYRRIRNDLSLLVGSGTDYFGEELTIRGKVFTREQAVDVVVGRYSEPIDEPEGILGRARRDYIRAVDALTDYPVTADGPSCVTQVAAAIKSILYGYRYGAIDAARVCREQGVSVPEGVDARKVYAALWPPRPGVEDPLVALLRNGAEVTRDDYDAIHVELARLAVETRKQFGEVK
jgi:hypothetical protein